MDTMILRESIVPCIKCHSYLQGYYTESSNFIVKKLNSTINRFTFSVKKKDMFVFLVL